MYLNTPMSAWWREFHLNKIEFNQHVEWASERGRAGGNICNPQGQHYMKKKLKQAIAFLQHDGGAAVIIWLAGLWKWKLFFVLFSQNATNCFSSFSSMALFTGFSVQISTIKHLLTSLESVNIYIIFSFHLNLLIRLGEAHRMWWQNWNVWCSDVSCFMIPQAWFFLQTLLPVITLAILTYSVVCAANWKHKSAFPFLFSNWFFKKLSFEKSFLLTSLWLHSTEISANWVTL